MATKFLNFIILTYNCIHMSTIYIYTKFEVYNTKDHRCEKMASKCKTFVTVAYNFIGIYILHNCTSA